MGNEMGNDMSSDNSNDEWLTVETVADVLNLKAVTIKRYAREGLLNGKQENNKWQFLASEIEKFKAIQAKL